jgi:uncharacterized protein
MLKRMLVLIVLLLTVSVTHAQESPLYPGISIDELSARTYGDGQLDVLETFRTYPTFTRQIIRYDSDGLDVYGFMNIPVGTGPFPVVVVIHGYVPPAQYETLSYTTRYADALAEAGFLVLHPNLRDHFPSDDDGIEVFEQVGYAVDVLNLAAHVREQGGLPGVLAAADPDHIGLWGHSMGGGITIRTITVDPTISAAVLYGSMNADERLNFQRINTFWTNGVDGNEELNTPPERLAEISPVNFLERITTPVSIHHGAVDSDVPVDWSVDLCARLTTLQKSVECYYYEGQDHILWGQSDAVFQQRVVEFFRLHLN